MKENTQMTILNKLEKEIAYLKDVARELKNLGKRKGGEKCVNSLAG